MRYPCSHIACACLPVVVFVRFSQEHTYLVLFSILLLIFVHAFHLVPSLASLCWAFAISQEYTISEAKSPLPI